MTLEIFLAIKLVAMVVVLVRPYMLDFEWLAFASCESEEICVFPTLLVNIRSDPRKQISDYFRITFVQIELANSFYCFCHVI